MSVTPSSEQAISKSEGRRQGSDTIENISILYKRKFPLPNPFCTPQWILHSQELHIFCEVSLFWLPPSSLDSFSSMICMLWQMPLWRAW
jgi:hypothetical protein